MKIIELINKLSEINPNTEVYVFNESNQLISPKLEFPNTELNLKRGIKHKNQILILN